LACFLISTFWKLIFCPFNQNLVILEIAGHFRVNGIRVKTLITITLLPEMHIANRWISEITRQRPISARSTLIKLLYFIEQNRRLPYITLTSG
jgi:hypothetical protein